MTWHKDHFKCSRCDKNLASETFFIKETSLYCKSDFMDLFSPRCSGCGGTIESIFLGFLLPFLLPFQFLSLSLSFLQSAEYIEHVGETWHKEHFCCAQCGIVLDNVPFYEVDGMAYCVDDYSTHFGSKCHVCEGFIEENGLECAGKSFHADCLGCHVSPSPSTFAD